MVNTRRTDAVIGHFDAAALAANYQCGHCNSETHSTTDQTTGIRHISIAHDPGCPVLTGTLTPLADTLRALTTSTRR